MKSRSEGKQREGRAPVAPRGRRPYRKPVLEVFGSLSKLTMGTSGTGGDANMLMIMSDRRAKHDIRRIGSHPLGFGIYLFSYREELRARWGGGRHVGFMADEVEAVLPEAVACQADGYNVVDYGLIARRAAAA